MNESDFEKELRAFRPAAPSNSLEGKIAAQLATAPMAGKIPRADAGWSRWIERLLWSSGGLAAGVLLATQLANPRQPVAAPAPTLAALPPTPPATIAPSGETAGPGFEDFVKSTTERVILSTEPGELLPDELLQPVRVGYVERTVWTNPKTGAVLADERTGEDEFFLPVSFQ